MAISFFLSSTVNSLTERILNGDMEVDANWSLVDTVSVGGSHFQSSEYVYEGNYSRALIADGFGVGIACDSFTTINSETYQLDFAIYGYYLGGSSYSETFSRGTDTNHDGWARTGTPNAFNTSLTSILLGTDADGVYNVFVEFQDVDIPKESVITSCVVRLHGNGVSIGTGIQLRNYFILLGNAQAPTNYSDYFSRSLTDPVSWNITSTWYAGSDYDTPDLSDILQQIVNSYDLSSAVWYCKDHVGSLKYRGFMSAANSATPELIVNWNAPGGGVQATKIKAVVKDGQGSLDNYSGEFAFNTNQWNTYSFRFDESQGGSGSQVIFSHADSSALEYYFDAVRLTYITSDAVQIYPDYEYKREKVLSKTDHRTKNGKAFSYKWGDYERWKIPVSYISKNKATTINSWWGNDSQLSLNITSGSITEANSVYMTNKKAPFASMNKPYVQYYSGTIELESTIGAKYYGGYVANPISLTLTVNSVNTASNQKVIKPDQIIASLTINSVHIVTQQGLQSLTLTINAATVSIS